MYNWAVICMIVQTNLLLGEGVEEEEEIFVSLNMGDGVESPLFSGEFSCSSCSVTNGLLLNLPSIVGISYNLIPPAVA